MPECARCSNPAALRINDEPVCVTCCRNMIYHVGAAVVIAEPLNWQPKEISTHA